MRRFLLKGLAFALILLVLLIGVLSIAVPQAYRYSRLNKYCEQSEWLYYRMALSDKPVDIALIGSSQIMCGVMDSMLTRLSGKQVANLALCRYGRDVQYLILQDLLEYHQPELVVIELRAMENNNSHLSYADLASTPQLLLPKPGYNYDYFRNLFNGLLLRQRYISDKLSGQWLANAEYAEYNSPYRYYPAQHVAEPTSLHSKAEKRIAKEAKTKAGSWYNFERSRAMGHIQLMADLCKEYQVPFTFAFVPYYGSSLQKPLAYDKFSDMGNVLLPPTNLLAADSLWADANHMNSYGASLYTHWLYTAISR